MSGKEKPDPDIADASTWELRHQNAADNTDHSPYFFDSENKESSILSEFGWTILSESSGNFVDLPPIEPDFAEIRAVEDSVLMSRRFEPIIEGLASASPSNPSISSSSSDDQPEKPTGSGISSSADAKPLPDAAGRTKKKGEKRIRQPRFAFVTETEVDHLEDGYRWRKYGQKAVKNSKFSRSYYRCTNSKCMVKKRIERSSEDPSVVITTYEGQHCHHSVGYPNLTPYNTNSSLLNHPTLPHPPPPNSLRPFSASSQLPEEGLLGDIVPPRMRNNG